MDFTETTRQRKVSRLLQKELGSYFQRNSTLFGNKIITVTVVRISPDLSVAKIYLSIFPVKPGENILQIIKEHSGTIRHSLGSQVKNQLRIIPELSFFIDDSLDYIEKIDNLLK